MNYNTLSITFFIRKERIRKDGKVPVYLRITVNKKRAEVSLNRFILPGAWIKKAGRLKGYTQEIKDLNTYFDIVRSKIYQHQKELLEKDELVTAKALKNRYIGKSINDRTLKEIFEMHNKRMAEKLGVEYAPATIQRYSTTLMHVKEFLSYTYNISDIKLKALNNSFILDFEHYFKTVKSCNHNTTIKYLKNLRKVINFAIKYDYLENDPFRKFDGKIKPVKREFLTQEELETIESKDSKIPRLELVKDVFIFCCYTGLSYIDVANLTNDNIRIGIDKERWIFIERTKTKTKSNIPLLSKPLEIIEKYKSHPVVLNENKLLPVLSNVKLNAYLKEIADLCGIQKNITFHMARHTFATTVTLTNDVPIETVSSMLGHKDLRTTQIYAKIVEKKISEDMQILKQKLNTNEKTINHEVKNKIS